MGLRTISSLLIIPVYLTLAFSGTIGRTLWGVAGGTVLGLDFESWMSVHGAMVAALAVLLMLHIKYHWSWIKKLFKYSKFRSLITSLVIVLNLMQPLTSAIFTLNLGNPGLVASATELHAKIGLVAVFFVCIHIFNNRDWFKRTFGGQK